jgi:hypothetical protein
MRPASSTFSGTVVPLKPVLRDDDVDRQVRPLQHGSRGVHAADLDIFSERLAADADRKDRHLTGAQPEQRFLDRRLFGVGAVGHHYKTSERETENSSLARCSASPSFVCVPSNPRSRGDEMRSAVELKRKYRTA